MTKFSKQIRIFLTVSCVFLYSVVNSQNIKFMELGPVELVPNSSSNSAYSLFFSADYADDSIKIQISGDDKSSFLIDKTFVLPAQGGGVELDSVKVSYLPSGESEHLAILNFSIGDSIYSQFVLNGISNGAVTVESISQSKMPENIKLVNGELLIELERPLDLFIYDTKGVLKNKVFLTQGSNKITQLQSGVWILRFDNRIYKLKI